MLRFATQWSHPLSRYAKIVAFRISQLPPARSVCKASGESVTTSATTAPKSRKYPDEPRVGIGAVLLRSAPDGDPNLTEILMIKRGTEPRIGWWSFPGGSLELGETILDCVMREVEEETGLEMCCGPPKEGASGLQVALSRPVPFTAADVIHRDPDGCIAFHYAIIEVAGTPVDPSAPLRPQADVDDAAWIPYKQLPAMPKVNKQCPEIAELAVKMFVLGEAATQVAAA